MPASVGVGVDDNEPTRPRGPRSAKGESECPVDIVEGRAWTLLLEHLLSQSEILEHEVGSAQTHCAYGSGAKRGEEDDNTQHGGGVSPSSGVELKRM